MSWYLWSKLHSEVPLTQSSYVFSYLLTPFCSSWCFLYEQKHLAQIYRRRDRGATHQDKQHTVVDVETKAWTTTKIHWTSPQTWPGCQTKLLSCGSSTACVLASGRRKFLECSTPTEPHRSPAGQRLIRNSAYFWGNSSEMGSQLGALVLRGVAASDSCVTMQRSVVIKTSAWQQSADLNRRHSAVSSDLDYSVKIHLDHHSL